MFLSTTTTDTALMMEEYVDWDAMLADCASQPSDASSSVCSTSSRAESPTSDPTRIYTPSCLERDLCRDYTCCGLRLEDLHALVSHFEEAHVVCASSSSEAVGLLLDPVTSAFGTFVVRRTSDARAARAPGPYPTRRLDEAPVCLSLRELERAKPQADKPEGGGERKKYLCPRAGCIKSYRNASGLDYHLRKGTCVVRAC